MVMSLYLVSLILFFPPSSSIKNVSRNICLTDDCTIDIRRGEILLGFFVRAGAWIDGVEILTSLGRKSGLYGNANGGSGYVYFTLLLFLNALLLLVPAKSREYLD